MKILFVIYADTKSLLEKIHTLENNPEKLITTKINKQNACVYSILTHYAFNNRNNKHDHHGNKE